MDISRVADPDIFGAIRYFQGSDPGFLCSNSKGSNPYPNFVGFFQHISKGRIRFVFLNACLICLCVYLSLSLSFHKSHFPRFHEQFVLVVLLNGILQFSSFFSPGPCTNRGWPGALQALSYEAVYSLFYVL